MFRKPLPRDKRIELIKRALFHEEAIAKQVSQNEIPDYQMLTFLSETYDELGMRPEAKKLKDESAIAAEDWNKISKNSGIHEIEWK